MMESNERPFGELPAALVEDILKHSDHLTEQLLEHFEQVREQRQRWRDKLLESSWLCRDAELPYMPIPTTCGVDGSYAIERLLANDLVAAAAVAVEGLTPPSETRYWPEPRHLAWIESESHEAETSTILRALMIGMELELAIQAPHTIVFLDGSLTTPLIYFNQAMNKCKETPDLQTTNYFLHHIRDFLEAYSIVLCSPRTDRNWVAVPKYTTRREIGELQGWPEVYDDRALLTLIMEPGEFTKPISLAQPSEPWHINLSVLPSETRTIASSLGEQITHSLGEIQVVYYRPYLWLPAIRLEMGRAVADNRARLATVLHGVRHQCGSPAIMEPYPLYIADRMVKHLPKAIPTFRQVTSQKIAEAYRGNIVEVFLGLHGYRTESGV